VIVSVADEAEEARDYLAMARSAEENDKHPELTVAEYAAIGQGYATLAVAEAIMHLADQLPAPGTAELVEAIGALTTAVRSVDGEVASLRVTVDNMST
jgi:hypothetical protein